MTIVISSSFLCDCLGVDTQRSASQRFAKHIAAESTKKALLQIDLESRNSFTDQSWRFRHRDCIACS